MPEVLEKYKPQAAIAANMPINRDFLYEYAKNPQLQQAAREGVHQHHGRCTELRSG
jgi:hypothetical protein